MLRLPAVPGGAWHTLTVALPTAGERFFYLAITEPSPVDRADLDRPAVTIAITPRVAGRRAPGSKAIYLSVR